MTNDYTADRPPREPAAARPSRGVALLACAVLLTGLFAANSASAQTTIWEATLTPGEYTIGGETNTGFIGVGTDLAGTLSDTDFVYDGTTYTIDEISRRHSNGQLDLTFAGCCTVLPDDSSSWILESAGTQIALKDLESSAFFPSIYRVSGAPNWQDGQAVTVKIFSPGVPPSRVRNLTARAGNQQVHVEWDQPETIGEPGVYLFHYEYQRKVGSGTWGEWIQSPAQTQQTTGFTLKGLNNGTVYSFRVRLINTQRLAGPDGETVTATPVATYRLSHTHWGIRRGGEGTPVTLSVDGGPFRGRQTYTLHWNGNPVNQAPLHADNPTTMVLPAGQNQVTVQLRAAADADGADKVYNPEVQYPLVARQSGTEVVRTRPGRLYDGNLSVHDNEPEPVASLEAPEIVDEGEDFRLTVRFGHRLDRDADIGFGFSNPSRAKWNLTGVPAPRVITIPAGDLVATTGRIRKPDNANKDTDTEITFVLSQPARDDPWKLGDSAKTVRINDDETPESDYRRGPWLRIGPASGRESGDGSDTSMTFRVNLDDRRTTQTTVSVDYRTVDKTARAGSDYLAASGTLTFAPGEKSKEFDVTIKDDQVAENEETFEVRLEDPTGGGRIHPYKGKTTGTILTADLAVTSAALTSDPNDDGRDGDDGVYAIGDVIRATVTFNRPVTVDRSGGTPFLTLEVGAGTVQARYYSGSGTDRLVFAYTVAENDEDSDGVAIAANGLKPDGGGIEDAQGAAAVLIHGATPAAARHRVDGVRPLLLSAMRPTGGDTFILTFSEPISSVASTSFGFRDVNEFHLPTPVEAVISGAAVELAPPTTFDINLVGSIDIGLGGVRDLAGNGNATTSLFAVSASSLPQVSVADAEGTEGTDPSVDFTVRLSAAQTGTVTIDYNTQDGTATAGSDYTARSGTLTFNAGETEKTVSVPIIDDTVPDDGETFVLVLTNPAGATLGNAMATGTIRNTEEEEPTTPANTLTASFPESPYASRLHKGASDRAQVVVAFSEAVESFSKGTPSVLVTGGTIRSFQAHTEDGLSNAWIFFVTPDGDGDVTFTLAAGAACDNGGICTAGGTTLTEVPATRTIPGPDPAADADEAEEAAEAPLTASFTDVPAVHDGRGSVSLELAFSDDVGISYATLRDDAFEVDEGDVTAARRVDGRHDLWEITVEPDGQEAVTVTLPGDRACGTTGAVCTRGENPRALSNSPSATVAGPTVAATPTVSIAGGRGTEGDDSAIGFAVTLDRAATAAVTVDYATSNGSATAGEDYTATSGTLSFAAGETGKTVSVPIGDDNENEGDETFTVTLSNASGAALGTASATGTIENRHVVPLTASFEQVPAEHDGTTFVFHVRFSEDPAVSYWVLRDDAFAVTGGEVDAARRKDGRDDLREIHVAPSGNGDVTVSLPPTTDCNADGAICTADDRPLSNANAATVRAMAALSAADAETTEGAGATLEFAVTLSRAASGTVTVGYATSDGTAVAGTDYTSASGTLTFGPGETSRTVSVTVLDDTVDDDGETLTLTLSNASGARLADATATGTINNADPLPRAWLVRFGRTSATQVVGLLTARFDEAATLSPQLTLGGRSWRLSALRGGADPVSAGADVPAETPSGRAGFASPAASTGLAGAGAHSPGDGAAWSDAAPASSAAPDHGVATAGGEATLLERTVWGLLTESAWQVDKRQFISRSSFDLSLSDLGNDPDESIETVAATPDVPGHWSLWGRGSLVHFGGVDDGMSLDGDVLTGLLGVDYARDRWLAGVALAYHDGDGSYRSAPHGDAGALDSALVSVNPYLRYALTDRLSVWGALGYGRGTLRLRPERDATVPQESIETGMQMGMGALGVRGTVYASERTELVLKSDALWVRTSSEDAPGMRAVDNADTSRIRLLLSGRHQRSLANDALLTPSFELGLRVDDGEAERGFGMELGGGLRYADPVRGLALETRARTLLAHEDGGYEEWGLSGSLTLDPGRLGRGLALRLDSGWGMADSGAEALWQRQSAAGLARPHDTPAQGRITAEMGYGLDVPYSYGILTPYSSVELAGGGSRTLRLGWRFELGQRLSLSLEGERRETALARPEHGLMLRTTLPW